VSASVIAALTMMSGLNRMSTIAQNIANATTSGFRQEVSVSRPFTEYLSVPPAAASGPGTTIPITLSRSDGTVTDFRAGALRSTGNPLDLAIEGDGFFEVGAEGGALYTRDGSFRLDSRGRLVTQAGMPIAGVGGEIIVASGRPVIDNQGVVIDNGKEVGRIKVVRFAQTQVLERAGPGLFAPGSGARGELTDASRVRQGFVEGSNVNTTHEMVRMIETVRHFEANQLLIRSYGDAVDRAIRRFGEF
jgi:flagellar basal-body rod protein FlgF